MKSILNLFFLLMICAIATSCSTNYYTVLLSEDANLYSSADSASTIMTIPKNTQVFLSSGPERKNYRKIKWGNYSGWAYNPVYTAYEGYTSVNSTSSGSSGYHYGTSSSGSAGKTVSVKGYTRKDGTYVHPHTRSAPSRRR